VNNQALDGTVLSGALGLRFVHEMRTAGRLGIANLTDWSIERSELMA